MNNQRLTNSKRLSKQHVKIGQIAQKYRQQIVALSSTLFLIFYATSVRADSIFKSAQTAMNCIVTKASVSGASSTLFQNLPVILFTSLELVIFGYFIYTVVQSVSSYGRGEEVTHVIQQPLFTFVFVIIIFVFQSLMFGSSGGC